MRSPRPQIADRGSQPLEGRRIVVTRPRGQADDFAERLEALGAVPVLFPTIRIVPPADAEPLRRAAREVASYDWLVLTSVNGVRFFSDALQSVGGDPTWLARLRVACIGPATASAAEERLGVTVAVVPETYVAESLVEALAATDDLHGRHVLLPRAAEARDVLPDGLRERGAQVDEVPAYRTLLDADGAAELRGRLDRGAIDALTFTASSTVRNFVKAVGVHTGDAIVASIGPITSGTARELGLDVDVEAGEHTIPGLVDALVGFYGGRKH